MKFSKNIHTYEMFLYAGNGKEILDIRPCAPRLLYTAANRPEQHLWLNLLVGHPHGRISIGVMCRHHNVSGETVENQVTENLGLPGIAVTREGDFLPVDSDAHYVGLQQSRFRASDSVQYH